MFSLKRIDWIIIVATVCLVAIGLLLQHAINLKDPSLAQEFSPAKQIWFAVIGIALLYLFIRIDYRVWFRFGILWYVLGIVFLAIVLAAGKSAQGATRWIDIGPFQFQPAEFIKLGLIFMLAWLHTKQRVLRRLRYLLLSVLLVGLPVALIILQPDLGSAIAIGFIWFVMVITSDFDKRHLALGIITVILFLPLLFNQLSPYQKERITTFLNPLADPQGAGYNVLQSTIAVGSGRLIGRGLSSGTQSQLNFLPSQHTDFIFAVLTEKLGFIGALVLLLLFSTLLIRSVLVAWWATDRFGYSLAIGISAMFFIHIVINVGMNLGLVPVTGIPLPFISYGGTNLIVSLIAVGILLSINLHKKRFEFSR